MPLFSLILRSLEDFSLFSFPSTTFSLEIVESFAGNNFDWCAPCSIVCWSSGFSSLGVSLRLIAGERAFLGAQRKENPMKENSLGEWKRKKTTFLHVGLMMETKKREEFIALSPSFVELTHHHTKKSIVSSLVAWCKFNQFSDPSEISLARRYNCFCAISRAVGRGDDGDFGEWKTSAFGKVLFRLFPPQSTTREGVAHFYSDILGKSVKKFSIVLAADSVQSIWSNSGGLALSRATKGGLENFIEKMSRK